MMNWFGRKKSEPTKPDVAAVLHSPLPPQPVYRELKQIPGLGQPNYDALDELYFSNAGKPVSELTSLVIIGVGFFGSIVLKKYSAIMKAAGQPVASPVRLINILLDGEPEPDYEIQDPEKVVNLQAASEDLKIEVARTTNLFDWYKSEMNWTRSVGRLAVFQGLNKQPTHLWDILQKVLSRGNGEKPPSIWIVGTTFGPASGAVLDLAHLVRLISARQKYVPDINLLLALPGQGWGFTHIAESAAMLREIERLMRLDATRHYDAYAPQSDNPDLLEQIMRGDEDITALLLCEPDPELYGFPAAEKILSEMAEGLAVFSQKNCWEGDGGIQKFLRASKKSLNDNEEVCASAFGVSAHLVPLEELKKIVHSRLAKDILHDRNLGIIKTWNSDDVEITDDGVKAFLQSCEHPILEILGSVKNSFEFPQTWPATAQINIFLAEGLRKKFQNYIDQNPTMLGLATCSALLDGIFYYFERMAFPDTIVNNEQLLPVLENARMEIKAWLSGCKESRDFIDQQIRVTEQSWQSTLGSGVGQGFDFNTILKGLMAGLKKYDEKVSLSSKIREHVRAAWIRNDEKLELKLHILGPGWKDKAVTTLPPARFSSIALWENVMAVVAAMTQNEVLWPNSLMVVDANRLQKEITGGPRLTLKYDPGKFTADVIQSTLGIVASGDPIWLKQPWLDSASNPHSVKAFSGTAGFLMKLHQTIPLSSIPSVLRSHETYYRSRKVAQSLHVMRAEQIAAKLEEKAFSLMGLVDQKKMPYQKLLHTTVDLLDSFERVDLFVKAWGSGFIRKGKGKNEICLSLSKNAPIWSCKSGNHVFDALTEFVTMESEAFKKIKAELDSVDFGESPLDNLKQIENWWSHLERKDFDWYILVTGILGKRR